MGRFARSFAGRGAFPVRIERLDLAYRVTAFWRGASALSCSTGSTEIGGSSGSRPVACATATRPCRPLEAEPRTSGAALGPGADALDERGRGGRLLAVRLVDRCGAVRAIALPKMLTASSYRPRSTASAPASFHSSGASSACDFSRVRPLPRSARSAARRARAPTRRPRSGARAGPPSSAARSPRPASPAGGGARRGP